MVLRGKYGPCQLGSREFYPYGTQSAKSARQVPSGPAGAQKVVGLGRLLNILSVRARVPPLQLSPILEQAAEGEFQTTQQIWACHEIQAT